MSVIFSMYIGSSISSLELATHSFPPTSPSRCTDVGLWAPCICTLEMCIGWYPCGLKYCKGKPENNNGIANNAKFRCGIKTCRKCNQYSYYVRQKTACLWDDWPTTTTIQLNRENTFFSSLIKLSGTNYCYWNDVTTLCTHTLFYGYGDNVKILENQWSM